MDYLGALLLLLLATWIALPFAVFGVKRLLQEILEHLIGIRSDVGQISREVYELRKEREL
jgi:hypothetical protein